MKIVIAAWHLKNFNVGLGRYCRGLIEALGRVDRENSYEILIPHEEDRLPAFPHVRYRIIRFPVFKRRFWEQVAPLLASRHDILHLPYDSCVGYTRARLVTTVHDLKPMLFGTASKGLNLNTWVERVIVRDKWARIDHVVTDSTCSRDDLVKFVGVPADRITVVYPGVDHDLFRPGSKTQAEVEAEVQERAPRTGLTSTSNSTFSSVERPYVLCVAGADPTKNVHTLIDAFAKLPPSLRDLYDLVVVGDLRRRSELGQRAGRLGLEKQVRFPGIVDDDELVRWYQRADVFLFPSLYEGFGLPVLEAMACGCPVVSSNASSLPEVAGDAALLVEPQDIEGWARVTEGVLCDPGARQEMRQRGLAQAARFTWDRTARGTIDAYRKASKASG